MTIASLDDTIRTDLTRTSYIQPTEETTDWSALKEFGEQIVEAITQNMMDPLNKRVRALELELAQTRGALDVLRGRGAPGTFRAKGTYDARTVYNYLDVVTKDSSSFVALRDSPGTCPGDGWQMIACGGKRGPEGQRGPAGPMGPAPRFSGAGFSHRGMEIQTSDGVISLFRSIKVDPQSFTLKFIANDDSALTISLLPLFQSFHAQTTGRGG